MFYIFKYLFLVLCVETACFCLFVAILHWDYFFCLFFFIYELFMMSLAYIFYRTVSYSGFFNFLRFSVFVLCGPFDYMAIIEDKIAILEALEVFKNLNVSEFWEVLESQNVSEITYNYKTLYFLIFMIGIVILVL